MKTLTYPLLQLYVKYKLPEKPIFIVGCGRSGTTLLLALMGVHPKIFSIPYETNSFYYRTTQKRNPPISAKNRINRALLKHHQKLSGKHRFCEKTPAHVYCIPEILEAFHQRVKIIHIVRDGRDVITSIHPHQKDQYWVPIERWIEDTQAGIRFVNHPGVYTLKYEDLVLFPERSLSKLLAFLDEPYYPLHQKMEKAQVFSNEYNQRNKTLIKAGIGRWKSDIHQAIIQQFYEDPKAIELLEKLDYTL